METMKGFKNGSKQQSKSLLLASISNIGETSPMNTKNLERVLSQVGNLPLSVISIIGFSNQGPSLLFAHFHQFLQESTGEIETIVCPDDETSPPNQIEIWTASEPCIQTFQEKEEAVILLYTKCRIADFDKANSFISSFVKLNLHASFATVIYHPYMLSESLCHSFAAFINKCLPNVESKEIIPSCQKLKLLIPVSPADMAQKGQFAFNNRFPQKAATIWTSTARHFETFDYHFIPQIGNCTDIKETLENNEDFQLHLNSFVSNLVFNLGIKNSNANELRTETLRMMLQMYVSGENCPKLDNASVLQHPSKRHQATQNTTAIKSRLMKQIENISERKPTGLAGSLPTPILPPQVSPRKSRPKITRKPKPLTDSDSLDDDISSSKLKYAGKITQSEDEQSDNKTNYHQPSHREREQKWNTKQSESEDEEVIPTKQKSKEASKWQKSSSGSGSDGTDRKNRQKPGLPIIKPRSSLPARTKTQPIADSSEEESIPSSVSTKCPSPKIIHKNLLAEKVNYKHSARTTAPKRYTEFSDSEDSDKAQNSSGPKNVPSLKIPMRQTQKIGDTDKSLKNKFQTQNDFQKPAPHENKKLGNVLDSSKATLFPTKFNAKKDNSTFSEQFTDESSDDEVPKPVSGPSNANLKRSPNEGISKTKKYIPETSSMNASFATYFAQRITHGSAGRKNESSDSD